MTAQTKMKRKVKIVKENFLWWKRSLKWKRDNSIILFGAWFGERYADTSRFLFQYLSDNKDKYALSHVVWVTRSKVVKKEIEDLGYEVYIMDSKESIHFHKVAGTHIICNMSETGEMYSGDIIGCYSYGAKKINLWHGVMPMKGVAMASNEYKLEKQRNPVKCFIQEMLVHHSRLYRSFINSSGGWGNGYYLSVTPAGTDTLRQFFGLPKNHYIETGSPRVCGEVKLTEREKRFVDLIKGYKKIVLYLPTFRDSASTFDYNHVAEPLQDYLKEADAIWVQKAHSAVSSASYEWIKDGNIIYLSSDFDINIIIKNISLLVTDFSSVAADAIYYYKPIVYYMPDYNEYMSKDRGFVVDPETVIMGPKVYSIDELKQKIDYFLKNDFRPNQCYITARVKYWGIEKTMDNIWGDIKKALHV